MFVCYLIHLKILVSNSESRTRVWNISKQGIAENEKKEFHGG